VRTANASLRKPAASVKFYQAKLSGCWGLTDDCSPPLRGSSWASVGNWASRPRLPPPPPWPGMPSPPKQTEWFYIEEHATSQVARPTSSQEAEATADAAAAAAAAAARSGSPVGSADHSMLPAWRQSFLNKLEAKAALDDELGISRRRTVFDKLSQREAPKGLGATCLAPLGEQIWRKDTQTVAEKKSQDIRRVFDQIDRDGDGYLCASDLDRQYKELWAREPSAAWFRPKCCKACLRGAPVCSTSTGGVCDIRKLIFEGDDDGDGVVGWEEFCNLWVRLKKPLGAEECQHPMALFNLIDFLHMDLIHGSATGAINSNKMLQLFHFRYQRVAALEVRFSHLFLEFR
jgi:hypothetical protein